jgi:hypothetical protein
MPKTKTCTFRLEQNVAKAMAAFLLEKSQWFELEPWPDDWWLLTAKSENKTLITQAILQLKRHVIKIRWGAEQTRKDNKDAYAVYDFESKAELDAFMKGVDEASGWTAYEIV